MIFNPDWAELRFIKMIKGLPEMLHTSWGSAHGDEAGYLLREMIWVPYEELLLKCEWELRMLRSQVLSAQIEYWRTNRPNHIFLVNFLPAEPTRFFSATNDFQEWVSPLVLMEPYLAT